MCVKKKAAFNEQMELFPARIISFSQKERRAKEGRGKGVLQNLRFPSVPVYLFFQRTEKPE